MKSYTMDQGIKVFQYGEPLETQIIQGQKTPADLAGLLITFSEGRSKLVFPLEAEAVLYGLGGNLGGMNKRGRVYDSYCTDEPNHTEDKTALYGAHNFFIISGARSCGYFIDFPARIKYDAGFLRPTG